MSDGETAEQKKARLEFHLSQLEAMQDSIDAQHIRQVIFCAGEMTYPVEIADAPEELVYGLKEVLQKAIAEAKKELGQ